MIYDIAAIWQKYSYVFVEGIKWTLILTVITVFFGTILGVFIAMAKMSKNKLLNGITFVYIEIIRGAPMLLQLYFFWLWLPKAMPFEMSERDCILVALIINSSAYIAEIIRAGIQAVDKGQTEAARSIGMTQAQTMKFIVIPQAFKIIIPALGNEFITLIKETAVLSVITVRDITRASMLWASTSFVYWPAYLGTAICYLTLTIPLSKFMNWVERKMASDVKS